MLDLNLALKLQTSLLRTMAESQLGIVVLAAGEARRFGACKQLAEFQSKPLLQHVVDAALPLPHKRLLIITGKYDQEIRTASEGGLFRDAELVYNPDWLEGMSSSIRLGCQLLGSDCDQLLVLLSDQILISTNELDALISAADSTNIACAGFSETLGPPAVFGRSFYPALRSLNTQNGAKRILTNPDNRVRVIPMASAGWDVDTPKDLENLVDVGSYTFGN